jgi:hypothetical protein
VCTRYAELLTEHSTFAAATIENLLDGGALHPETHTALRNRYIVD